MLVRTALGIGLLALPVSMLAQRGGGGGHGAPVTGMGTGGGGLSSVGHPDGVDERDDLKTFHQAMEVQATSDQAAAFLKIVKNTEAANTQLTAFEKENDTSKLQGRAVELKQSLEGVRIQTKNFVEALSLKQKTGLKETTARLAKAESELGDQEKLLDASPADGKREDVRASAHTEALEKALADFRSQQGRLAGEMGIVLSGELPPTFRIQDFKTSAKIGGEQIAISSSAVISRIGAEDGKSVYKIKSMMDLSDLQPNIGAVLGAQIDNGELCGERFALQDATLTPSAPSTLLVAHFYAERWVCSRIAGKATPHEIAQGNGTAEVKVTPAVGANGELEIKTELGHVEASGFLAEMLHSGQLGTTLREKIASSLLAAIHSADFKATLPPAATDSAKIEAARFESSDTGNLSVTLDGEMRISEEQAALLGNQLKERLSSQAVVPPQPRSAPDTQLQRPEKQP